MRRSLQLRPFFVGLLLCLAVGSQYSLAQSGAWTFALSGDSRNCGDIVMPAIAAGAAEHKAKFYLHLGDMRLMSKGKIDEDIARRPDLLAVGKQLSQSEYLEMAFQDFLDNQVTPFGKMPVYLGIGNHELGSQKTRADFVARFSKWLDAPVLRKQRLKDSRGDFSVKTFFHWQQNGVDFIYLDNASREQFDDAQLKWFQGVLQRAKVKPAIKAVVVGTHAPLPYSVAAHHSMNDNQQQEQSGLRAYQDLLSFQAESKKRVYIVSSHSHFYMSGIYNTQYWREHGGVLPGWIVGTAGALRYKLPAELGQASDARTNTYGYLLGAVNREGSINFEFREVRQDDVPLSTVKKYGADLVHYCFVENHQ